MQVNRIEDLPPEPGRAVIINVGTELMTTLALGKRRHALLDAHAVDHLRSLSGEPKSLQQADGPMGLRCLGGSPP
jgi:hypothetical protein